MQYNPLNPDSAISTNLFAGIDHRSLDKRNFDPSTNDIEHLCRFFAIGKLKHYQKEKGIIVSHSNFFVFVVTARGEYALKFYSTDEAKTITIEHALNRFLIDRHFPTPIMYAGRDGQHFLTSNGRLATCYSYINGHHAYQQITQKNIISKINTTILSLKKTLMMIKRLILLRKTENLVTAINTLVKTSQALSPYDQKKMINISLKNVYQAYQRHPSLFSRQQMHNNTHLANFLISKETVYTLDLSHICEDYALSDLASLVVSCLFLEIPEKTVKMVVKDYFAQHELKPEYTTTLNTLVQIELIKEYLLNLHREKSVDFSAYPTDLVRTYRSQLLARMRSIAAFLQPKALDHLV